MRRARSRPPLGVALTYSRTLRAWFAKRQVKLAAEILDTWEHHITRGRFRHDARRLGPVKVEVEQSTINAVASRVAKKNAAEMHRVIGIPTATVAPPKAIETWRHTNLDLITKLAGNEVDRLEELLVTADQTAMRVEDLRKLVQDEFDITKRHADLIARDQVLKLNGQLNQERQTSAGITEYIWSGSEDERERLMHVELNNTLQSWDDPPVTNEQGDTNHPGEDFQCRCVAIPIIPELGDATDE